MSFSAVDFPTPLTSGPLAMEVLSTSRLASNIVALGLARRVNPRFLWLEVRGTSGLAEIDGGLLPSLIPSGQLFVTERAEELRPDPGVANMALWSMVSSQESPEVLARLRDFLLLPQPLQRLLSAVEPSARPGVVVVSNSDRIPGFCPEDAEEARSMLDAFRNGGATLICTTKGVEPSPAPFDHVFRVDIAPGSSWEDARLSDVLRAGDTPTFASPVLLGQVPSIREVVVTSELSHPSWMW